MNDSELARNYFEAHEVYAYWHKMMSIMTSMSESEKREGYEKAGASLVAAVRAITNG